MLIKNAKMFRSDGTFEQSAIAVDGQRFSTESTTGKEFDAKGCYAIPGLIDLHIHGCVGHDFSDSDIDGIVKMTQYQASNGVSAICPTTLTLPEEQLTLACRRIASTPALNDGASIVGIHLEGPFLSPNKIGAQNSDYVNPPNLDMFRRLQVASDGLVKLLSIAPEIPGAMELIDALKDEICCSLAHTTADYDTATQALRRGARQVTHLFNAMPPLAHREPGVIGAAIDSPHCNVELICDGVHVHPAAVRAAFKLFGDERIILISDSFMAAGLGDGTYKMGRLKVKVKGNLAQLAEGETIAGSVTTLMGIVRTTVTQMNIPLGIAVKCASVNPAKALGIYDEHGSISPGKFANLVLLNDDLSINRVLLRGNFL